MQNRKQYEFNLFISSTIYVKTETEYVKCHCADQLPKNNTSKKKGNETNFSPLATEYLIVLSVVRIYS